MAQLAIKGHETRGKEVIELLEMLGGKNKNLTGDVGTCVVNPKIYFIEDNNIYWYYYGGLECDGRLENMCIFTLEEFEEKYPYKVGDKVIAYAEYCIAQFTIQDMRWNYELNKVEYKICTSWYDTSLMQPYKEETMEEKGDKAKALNLVGEDYSGKRFVYKIPDGYEFDTIYNNEIILKPKKPKYPTTYKECCEVLCIGTMDNDAQGYKADLIIRFQELIIARNVYWKIAGEELGLDKPWEPDWKDSSQQKFTIFYYQDEASLSKGPNVNRFLSFPTEEMRDIFYENFKNLIENCKELL